VKLLRDAAVSMLQGDAVEIYVITKDGTQREVLSLKKD
jgi:hypothetical protein